MKIPIVMAASLLTVVLSGATSRAANHTVHMTDSWIFSPSSLTIDAGDTVTWINDDESFFHDATSTTALWTTGSIDFEESATLAFDTPGTYPYRDSLFYGFRMIGTINVNEPPVEPQMSQPLLLPSGAFRFTLINLTAGKTNVIETSTNLLAWSPKATNVAAGTSLDFTNAAVGSRFYRFWQAP